MAQLRSKSVKHLGMVKRLYLEASGSFTLIREEKGKPGLNILPELDVNFHHRLKRSTDVEVCKKCGSTKSRNDPGLCGNCGNNTWEKAVE